MCGCENCLKINSSSSSSLLTFPTISNPSSSSETLSEADSISLALTLSIRQSAERIFRITDHRYTEKPRIPPAHIYDVLEHRVPSFDAPLNCFVNRQIFKGLRSFLFSLAMSFSHFLRYNNSALTNMSIKGLQPFHRDRCCHPRICIEPANALKRRVKQTSRNKTKGVSKLPL